jgi:hypothetical protein
MRWLDSWWNDSEAIVCMAQTTTPDIRATCYYGLGLLMRGSAGDIPRGLRALTTVLDHQWNSPGKEIHGSFARTPRERGAQNAPRVWETYDPNFREFIGVTLALILERFSDVLSGDLAERIRQALQRAAEGDLARAVPWSYTNISLQSAWLLAWCGTKLGESGWSERGLALAEEIHEHFGAYDTFPEFNSPTYYAVDLYALALWRTHGPTDRMRRMGVGMEEALWREIGESYHAGLRNLCGPWTRAYGRDMTTYCAALGLYVGMLAGLEHAPLPDLSRPCPHLHDLGLVPLVVLLGTHAPDTVVESLSGFRGPRLLSRTFRDKPPHTATSWLGEQLMAGGIASDGSGNTTSRTLCHPAMVHWRMPNGGIGWLRAVCDAPLNAVAAENRLSLTILGDRPDSRAAVIAFEVSAKGVEPGRIGRRQWDLPGLIVELEGTPGLQAVDRREDTAMVEYSPVSGRSEIVLALRGLMGDCPRGG